VNLQRLSETYERIRTDFSALVPNTKKEVARALQIYPYPKGVRLPANSDVDFVDQLFSPKILAQLALLKSLIMKVRDRRIRGVLLLMFSGTLNKLNLTYHASAGRSPGRGDSAIFKYYRYRIAPNPGVLDVMSVMDSRFKKVVKAKREIARLITVDTIKKIEILKGDAADLSMI
jgi:hypothetical protein